MAFTQSTFAPVGANSTDTPKIYSYKTNDSLPVVTAPDYFLAKRFQFNAGDIILANISGSLDILTIASSGALGVAALVAISESPEKQVLINKLSDLPDPIAEVITLEDDTKYLLGDDINLGNNRIVLGDGTAIAGIESITVTLTYTGTGDMFTGVDNTTKINNLRIVCALGRFINWNDSLGKVLRLTDLGISCDRFGLFTGVLSSIRLTNVSPTTITSNGLLFAGTFLVVQYESSLANVTAGTLIDLGSATFAGLTISSVISAVPSGATFLSGLVSSGNIVVGGGGSMVSTSISGAGARLNNISTEDARWQFLLNDDVADTRPDGLLSMQGNAVATVIGSAGVPVCIAGVFTVARTSQMTGAATGRLTYIGGKNIVVPIDGAFTVEPVSGGSVDISIEVAIDGSVVPSSKRTANASAGNPAAISIPWQDELSTGQFTEFFVTNEDTTVNILVSSGTERIN